MQRNYKDLMRDVEKYMIAMEEEQRALYEIQEIIDRMHDIGVASTIYQIDKLVPMDDPRYEKHRRRQQYLYAMEQLYYDLRDYDTFDTDVDIDFDRMAIYRQYKENNRPHTW